MYKITAIMMIVGSLCAQAMENGPATIFQYNYEKHRVLVGAFLNQYKIDDGQFVPELHKSINSSSKNISCFSYEALETDICIEKNVVKGLVHYSEHYSNFFCVGKTNFAQIQWIQVAQPGQGMGSALLDATLETAKKHDCEYVIAQVPQHAYKAEKFFERNGFVATKTSNGNRSYRHYLD
ncbi:MAG TPA: GNAT family N-acetyltransferase [Candidatus Babeliales bacterium]|nr:GNAT family N-acetyltransferase [Candidatus Babeliales bacterium]